MGSSGGVWTGFGAGTKPFLIQIDFEAPDDISYMVRRGVGLLPELARKTSFEKDLCNPFLQDPCRKVKAGSRCPAEKGSKFNYVATFPFSGNYYRGLPVDLRVELHTLQTLHKIPVLITIICWILVNLLFV